MFITLFILSVVFVEALTELVVKSAIFARLRKSWMAKNDFLQEMLSCGYCASVWAAVIPALCLATYQTFCSSLLAFPLIWLSLHRFSNYMHNVNDKYFDKYYSKDKSVVPEADQAEVL